MSVTKMQADFEPLRGQEPEKSCRQWRAPEQDAEESRRSKLKKSAGVSSVIHRAFLKLDDEVAGQRLLQMVADICTP